MSDKDKVFRTFETGAIRDLDGSKLDYEGFLSPLVLEAFAQYMHEKRHLADGSLRDSDNWQKGMPLDTYMKSGFRHFMDWWANHRQVPGVAQEPLETALVALLFNVMGYLHETIKSRRNAEQLADLKADLGKWVEEEVLPVIMTTPDPGPVGFAHGFDVDAAQVHALGQHQVQVQPEVQLELFEDLPVQMVPEKPEAGDVSL